MASTSLSDSIERLDSKPHARYTDVEKQPTIENNEPKTIAPKSLGSGVGRNHNGETVSTLTVPDRARNRSLRNDTDHSVTEFDGVARSDNQQRFCRIAQACKQA